MLEPGQEAPLGLRAPHRLGIAQRAGQHLDRHPLLEGAVAALGQVHAAHAAGTERAQQAVGAELALAEGLHRRLQEAFAARVGRQQRLDLGGQRRIFGRGGARVFGALRRRQGERRLEDGQRARRVHARAR